MYVWALNETSSKPGMSSSKPEVKPNILKILFPPLVPSTPSRPAPTPTVIPIGPPTTAAGPSIPAIVISDPTVADPVLSLI